MLLWNLIGMAAIVAWNGFSSLMIFGALSKMGILRVGEETEAAGLDMQKHDQFAYPECKADNVTLSLKTSSHSV